MTEGHKSCYFASMQTLGRGVLLGVIALGVYSCQPDQPQPSGPDALQQLSGGSSRTWRLQTLAIAGSSQPIPSCRSDDRWTFRSDGSLTLQNPTTCSSDEFSPTATGTFRFTNNDRFLVLTLPNDYTEVREITQLSNNLMTWTYAGPDGNTWEETWIP